jgi:hypothetical protein
MRPFILILLIFFLVQVTTAQEFDKLKELKINSFRVYYSAGHEQRTTTIVQRVERAAIYNQQLLGIKPEFTVLVLTQNDWSTYTNFPVYGMPHYIPETRRLVVAAEDNPFWKSFLPPLDQLPPTVRESVSSIYKIEDGSISMRAFFDLLALHELGHTFHIQGGLTMQRKWMGELFCNILLHTYIAENEPELLPALTLFPKMVVAGGTKEFTYTSLNDIEEHYEEIGMRHAKNYGWYQSRWHMAAGNIYDTDGKQVLSKIWDALSTQKEKLTDDQLMALFEKAGAKGVSDMMRNWARETVR